MTYESVGGCYRSDVDTLRYHSRFTLLTILTKSRMVHFPLPVSNIGTVILSTSLHRHHRHRHPSNLTIYPTCYHTQRKRRYVAGRVNVNHRMETKTFCKRGVPYANFWGQIPVCKWGVPVCKRGFPECILGHLFLEGIIAK